MVSCGRAIINIHISYECREKNTDRKNEEESASESRSADEEIGKQINISSSIDEKSFEMAGYHIQPGLNGRIESDLKAMVSRKSAIFNFLTPLEHLDMEESGSTIEMSWSESNSLDKEINVIMSKSRPTPQNFCPRKVDIADEASSFTFVSDVLSPEKPLPDRQTGSIKVAWSRLNSIERKTIALVKSSKMACNRLYEQAKETKKKKATVRAKFLASEVKANRLVLATDTKTRKGGGRDEKKERFGRLNEMYKMGKRKIVLDRERYRMKQEEKAKLAKSMMCLPKRNNRYEINSLKLESSKCNTRGDRERRLCEMYEKGKQRIRGDRARINKQQPGS